LIEHASRDHADRQAPKPRVGGANRFFRREATAMPLTAQQLGDFAGRRLSVPPGCFSEEEVTVLRDEAERIYAESRPEVWREKPTRRVPPLRNIPLTRPFVW
jgi:hypothetical protein